MQHMYWFITISRKADAEEIIELYKRFEVPRLYCTLAHGTAKSQTLDLFGIEQSEKVVHQAVITHNKLRELKKTLEMDFQIDLPDRGIALAVPLASISTKNTLEFFSGGHAEDEMTDTEQKEKSTLELIIAICNKGYTEDVMEAARKAGAGGGVTESIRTSGNDDGMRVCLELLEKDFTGLSFINFVDFDTLYGHRRDAKGYAEAVMRLDAWLPRFIAGMKPDDILMITADHGCDPNFAGSDHTRENVPLLVYGRKIKPVDLGTLSTYSDIAATIAAYFGVPYSLNGKSFLNRIL